MLFHMLYHNKFDGNKKQNKKNKTTTYLSWIEVYLQVLSRAEIIRHVMNFYYARIHTTLIMKYSEKMVIGWYT